MVWENKKHFVRQQGSYETTTVFNQMNEMFIYVHLCSFTRVLKYEQQQVILLDSFIESKNYQTFG